MNSNIFVSRIKRRILSHLFLARLLLGALAVAIIFLIWSIMGTSILKITDNIFFFPKIGLSFFFGSPSRLANSEGRTNILLMGEGGAGHETPELTDTMIFISLDSSSTRPVFLSLPRDIWISSLRAKLNTTYYYGNQKKEGGGIILSKASVSEILSQPVHYGAVINFLGFIKLVDALGGIEVEVERSFDDYKYPIAGRENDQCNGDPELKCRYEQIRFERGKQTMNGETALKFVRSRNAEGEEGTDFARSNRQQRVVAAIRQKLLSPSVFLNPGKLSSIWAIVAESIKTDIPRNKLPIVARIFIGLKKEKIKNVVLDGGTPGDAQTGLLVNPPVSSRYDNQWVLIPKSGTWEDVGVWVKNLLLR